MAVTVGLATISIDEDDGTKLVGSSPRDVLHRSFYCKPSADEITKLLAGINVSDKDSAEVLAFTSKQLRAFTDNFNVKNKIGVTQFADVYRGKIQSGIITRNVVVKIWNEDADDLEDSRVPYIFVNEEVRFLKDKAMVSHPYLVNVMGKCCEENLRGIVYDLDPLDTLHNMMMTDDFNWIQRIMVALKFAQLLEFLHGQEKPYVVLSLDPRHIMLDHMLNPILFDFGLLSGGVIGDLSWIKKFIWPPAGYTDFEYCKVGWLHTGIDVHTFGIILIGMIAKKVVTREELRRDVPRLDVWARKEYRPSTSLVHKSLESECGYCASNASALTALCMRCIEPYGVHRPTMKEVVTSLEQLQVVRYLLSTKMQCSGMSTGSTML